MSDKINLHDGQLPPKGYKRDPHNKKIAVRVSPPKPDCGPPGPIGPPGPEGKEGKPGKDGRTGETGKAGERGQTGDKGDKGQKGDPGKQGQKGLKGDRGAKGEPGLSAYEIAKKHGFKGSEREFIQWLRSPKEYSMSIGSGGGGVSAQYVQNLWTSLKDTWTNTPVSVAYSGGDGEVFQYQYGSTFYYRFVPAVYDSTKDSFYSSFNDPSLTGLIATRGTSI